MSDTQTYSSDVAFTPAVKAIQARKGSRDAYAHVEQRGGWRTERSAGPPPPTMPPASRRPTSPIDLAAKEVRNGEGEAIRLTPTEWHLLEVLARNEGKLVSQVQLLKEVWGPAYETESNYLRVYMAQLRRKLEPDPPRPRYLITEPGMGYRFIGSPSS